MVKDCKHSPVIFVDEKTIKCEQCGLEREPTEREKFLYRIYLQTKSLGQ